MDERTGEIVAALRARRIRASHSSNPPGRDGVTIGIDVDLLERFLDTIIDHPITEDDRMTMRIFGRASELSAEDTEWHFEVVPGLSAQNLIRLHAYVTIPPEDVEEVLARLRDKRPID